jgi:hypothetical protein
MLAKLIREIQFYLLRRQLNRDKQTRQAYVIHRASVSRLDRCRI